MKNSFSFTKRRNTRGREHNHRFQWRKIHQRWTQGWRPRKVVWSPSFVTLVSPQNLSACEVFKGGFASAGGPNQILGPPPPRCLSSSRLVENHSRDGLNLVSPVVFRSPAYLNSIKMVVKEYPRRRQEISQKVENFPSQVVCVVSRRP